MEGLLCDLQGEFIQLEYDDDDYGAKNLHLSNGKDVLSCISLKCFAHLKKKADHTIYFCQAGAERKVSFDWGPDGSKAEDCFFGIVALDQVSKYLSNVQI